MTEKRSSSAMKNTKITGQKTTTQIIKKTFKKYFDKNTRKIDIQGTTWSSNGASTDGPGISNGEQNRHPWPLKLAQGPLKVHF